MIFRAFTCNLPLDNALPVNWCAPPLILAADWTADGLWLTRGEKMANEEEVLRRVPITMTHVQYEEGTKAV